MKQSKRVFEFSAIVKNFDELRFSLENHKLDAIFHSGMILYDKIELDKLCNDNKENLTVYEDNGTSIYYFRFGKKEYYDFMPFALSLKELKRIIENMIRPRVNTQEEIEINFQKSLTKLAEIFPRTDNYESLY